MRFLYNTARLLLMPAIMLAVISKTCTAQQTDTTTASNSKAVVLKASFLAPSIGISLPVGQKSAIRSTMFFTTDFYDDTEVLLDVSYLRYNSYNWGEHYYGLQSGILISEDLSLIPGLLTGIETMINRRISVFGEAVIGVFINTNDNDAMVGLFNSGIGIKWNL